MDYNIRFYFNNYWKTFKKVTTVFYLFSLIQTKRWASYSLSIVILNFEITLYIKRMYDI